MWSIGHGFREVGSGNEALAPVRQATRYGYYGLHIFDKREVLKKIKDGECNDRLMLQPLFQCSKAIICTHHLQEASIFIS